MQISFEYLYVNISISASSLIKGMPLYCKDNCGLEKKQISSAKLEISGIRHITETTITFSAHERFHTGLKHTMNCQ